MKNLQAAVIRDIGITILLLWAFAQALIMSLVESNEHLGYLVLIFAMDVVVLVGFSGRLSLCAVVSSMLTCVWVSYKLYSFYATGTTIQLADYLLAPMPLIGLASCWLFLRGLRSIDGENSMLRRQVEELVLVDQVTGLYNHRALYRDLRSLVKYTQRNHLPISLMIIQMRYESELRSMLPTRQYQRLLQTMADIVATCVRVEDKAYCIDGNGTLAVILTADETGCGFVRNRLRAALQQEDAFEGILDRGTRLDVRFACKEYDRERFGEDMMAFKTAVESELVYDV